MYILSLKLEIWAIFLNYMFCHCAITAITKYRYFGIQPSNSLLLRLLGTEQYSTKCPVFSFFVRVQYIMNFSALYYIFYKYMRIKWQYKHNDSFCI